MKSLFNMEYYTIPIQDLVNKLTSLLDEYEVASSAHATAKSEFQSMEDQEDSLLSTLKEQFTGPMTHKTDCAYRAQKYINFTTTKGRRRLDYYLAQSKMKALETKIDAIRTIISLRKEEINKFNG